MAQGEDDYDAYRRRQLALADSLRDVPDSTREPSPTPPDATETTTEGGLGIPWWLHAEGVRRGVARGLAEGAGGVAEAVGKAATGVALGGLGWFGHEIGDRAENLTSAAAYGLLGPPEPATPEETRLRQGQPPWSAFKDTPIATDPLSALKNTGRMAWEGVKPGMVPPGDLSPHGSFHDYLLRKTENPDLAVWLDLIGTYPAGEAIGVASQRALVPVAKMAGRATEPLRQLPGIQDALRLFSVAGDVRAFQPSRLLTPESRATERLPLWAEQLWNDVRDPRYREYVLKGIPDDTNLRELVRSKMRRGAGAQAYLTEKRVQRAEPAFNLLKNSMKDRYGLEDVDAGDMVREFLEEATRQPGGRAGWSLDEFRAFRELQDSLNEYLVRGQRLGVRETELHNRIDRWSRASENVYAKWTRLKDDLASADVALDEKRAELAKVPLRPNKGQSRLMLDVKRETIQNDIEVLSRHRGEVRLRMEKTHADLQAALGRFNELTYGVLGTPQQIGIDPLTRKEFPIFDVDASLARIRERSGWLVDYAPRSTTPEYQRFMGKQPKHGMQISGDLSSSLGGKRATDPKRTTQQMESLLKSEAEWRNWTDPNQPVSEQLKDFAQRLVGNTPEARVYEPFVEELSKNGLARDRSLAHAFTVRSILDDPLVTRVKDTAPAGWIPIGRRGKDGKEILNGLLSSFDDDTVEVLRGKYVSPDIFRFLENMQTPYVENAYRGLGAILPSINRAYKPLVTLVRGEFWTRNFAWSVYAQTARGNWNPANYVIGLGLSFGANPSQKITLGRYGTRTMGEVRDLFIKNRIIGGETGSLVQSGWPGMHQLGGAYQSIEDGLRASYGLHLLQSGMSLKQASRKIQEVMFNYGPESMTSFERGIRDQLMPFWGWTRNIPRLTMRDLGERPQAVGRLAQVQDIGFNQTQLPPDVKENMRHTPEAEERFGFPTGYDPETDAVSMANLGMIGYTDVGQYAFRRGRTNKAIGPFLSQLDQLASQFGPLLSLGYSSTTARKAFSSSDVQDVTQLPNWARGLPGTEWVPPEAEGGAGHVKGPGWMDLLMRMGGSAPNVPTDLLSNDLDRQEAIRKYLTGWPVQTTSLTNLLQRNAAREKVFWDQTKGAYWRDAILEERMKNDSEFQDVVSGRRTLGERTQGDEGLPVPGGNVGDSIREDDDDEYRRRQLEAADQMRREGGR